MGFETKNCAQESDWRESMRNAVRDATELARLLELPAGTLPDCSDSEPFPLLVPREFIARMRKGDPNDPLLRQILPTLAERESAAGFGADPLIEHELARHGSLQKYPGRALLITTGACPIHCRYCFRRAFPYSEQTAAREQWQPALEVLARSTGIREIILSGGDPLSLGNRQLATLIAQIEQSVPQTETLRIHTRFPVVLPSRIDRGLLELLATVPFRLVIVLHINHPAEIDANVARSASQLKNVTRALLNQAVLLRGINDDATTQIALGERLLDIGVMPYYLHLLDRVTGSSHFEVSDAAAQELVDSVRRQAPGYLVPKLVREEAGRLCKTPVA